MSDQLLDDVRRLQARVDFLTKALHVLLAEMDEDAFADFIGPDSLGVLRIPDPRAQGDLKAFKDERMEALKECILEREHIRQSPAFIQRLKASAARRT